MAEEGKGGSPKGRKGARSSKKASSQGRPSTVGTGRPRRNVVVGGSVRRGGRTGALVSGIRADCSDWLEQLREGIVIAQANPLRLLYANQAMVEITGYTVDELIALSPSDLEALIHPDDRGTFFGRFRMRLAGQTPPAHYELRGVRKDGTVIWLTIHAARIENRGRPAVIAAFTDITDYKRIEEEIRESETKLKAQYRAIPVPTYTWQKREEDFVLIDYNEAAHKITDGKIAGFIGVTLREMYRHVPEIVRSIEKCYREKKSCEEELEYQLRTTGEKKNLAMKYAYVPPDLVLVHTEDVTARAQAERELWEYRDHLEERIEERTAELQTVNERLNREIAERRKTEAELRGSEARYRAVVEDQTELIARFKPDTTLTFVNGASCRYMNINREEFIGKRFIDMISEENRQFVRKQLDSLTPDNPVSIHDQRTVFLNGEVRWQQWTNRAIFEDSGRIVEYQAVGRDITQRKEAEEALERSNRELGVLNEINSIVNSSEDSLTILHDMLTTISEYCEARYAALFEIDHKNCELRLVASCGVPDGVRDRVDRVDLKVASIQRILESSRVIVTEEDIPDVLSDEYRKIKEALGIKRTMAFISRSGDRANFLAFLGRDEDENVGDRIRNFLSIVSNQLGIALERIRLLKELGKSRAELKKLTSSLIEMIEEERRRMALRLHDDMGQSLVALNVEFDLLEKRVRTGEPIEEKTLKSIRRQLREITDSTRQISYSLHPPMLEDLGLVPAIQRYVERFITVKGLTVDVEASGFDAMLPHQIGLTLYRVAQEALTNIIRHSEARRAIVKLAKGYPRVIMSIEDDGKGFAFGKEPSRKGLGIVGMRERVERLGGDFRIHTNPGAGTRIRVTLPLEVEDAG